MRKMEILQLQKRILNIRGYRVVLDFHIAEWLGVEPLTIREAVWALEFGQAESSWFALTENEWWEVRRKCCKKVRNQRRNTLPEGLPVVVQVEAVLALTAQFRSERAADLGEMIRKAFGMMRRYIGGIWEMNWHLASLEAETGLIFGEMVETLNHVWEGRRNKSPTRTLGYKRPEIGDCWHQGIELDFE